MVSLLTFLSKDPPLVHAGGEEDGRLGDAHQQVCDGQVDDEHVGRSPKAAAPVVQNKRSLSGSDLICQELQTFNQTIQELS